MPTKRYPPVRAGEWVQPYKNQPYYMECCDCALVHKMEFRIFDGRVQMRAWRSERATKNQRKARGITITNAPD